MKNEIRLALCQKFDEMFGRKIKNHKDVFDLNGSINDGLNFDIISVSTLKRLFKFKGYDDDCKNIFGRKKETQEGIAKYLGYESWEHLMCELEIITNPKISAKELLQYRKNDKKTSK